jgi:hypothetical protein
LNVFHLFKHLRIFIKRILIKFNTKLELFLGLIKVLCLRIYEFQWSIWSAILIFKNSGIHHIDHHSHCAIEFYFLNLILVNLICIILLKKTTFFNPLNLFNLREYIYFFKLSGEINAILCVKFCCPFFTYNIFSNIWFFN